MLDARSRVRHFHFHPAFSANGASSLTAIADPLPIGGKVSERSSSELWRLSFNACKQRSFGRGSLTMTTRRLIFEVCQGKRVRNRHRAILENQRCHRPSYPTQWKRSRSYASIVLNGTRTRNSIEGRESAYRLDTCNHNILTSKVHGK